MKKTYSKPETSIELAEAIQMLASSVITGTIGGNNEIGFGGTDDDGGFDPSVKENTSDYSWDF